MKYVSSGEWKTLAQKNAPKGVGIRKQFDTSVESLPDRCVKFVISSDAVDRQMDKIDQDGWVLDSYLKNPVVLWGHNQDEPPVGKCISIGLEDGKLKAIVQFMPDSIPVYGAKAEAIYRMCCEGYLNATSVGFKPVEWTLTKDPERGANEWEPGADFHKAELVEFSIVSVPSNPEALLEATPLVQASDEPTAEPEMAKGINTTETRVSRERLKQQLFLLTL